ncbi:hypothetical protein NLJ89_g2744 [Agrocybe chaxingu]|uniref:Uncharacterized protein n=1 Tax=Agrocybe chaxingu TaxID=84603 RepID=A0A9W8K606_9AGAR|nr:hypothetical protein NLJ89_g2744 [Agrocybe chaxingu]
MEVVSVALTVCTICKAIETWIDLRAEKEEIIKQISSTVLQIHNILLPFASTEFKGTGEKELSNCIRSVGDVLQRTKEHLVVWVFKRSRKIVAFLNPAALVKMLKDDERQLNNQLIILLTSVAVVGYFRDHAKEAAQISPVLAPPAYSIDPLGELSDAQAQEFWRGYIGTKASVVVITFVEPALFSYRLIMWYDGELSKEACDRMIMLLDEYNAGDDACIAALPGHDDLRTPLLIWIDDEPENVEYEVEEARSKGIQVIELSSTAVAKAWVEANAAFLRENDDGSGVRFISDNVRLEESSDTRSFLNPYAGESFLRYLRGRSFKAPVLIYAGMSMPSTQYVNEYEAAGSTASSSLVLSYISDLAVGGNNVDNWRGFDRS